MARTVPDFPSKGGGDEDVIGQRGWGVVNKTAFLASKSLDSGKAQLAKGSRIMFFDTGHSGPYHPKDFDRTFESRVPEEKWKELAKGLPKSVISFDEAVAHLRKRLRHQK